MPDFRFFHLERRRVDQALADILVSALAEGQRVVVQAPSPEMVEALNDRLWTYADESFLPHGSTRDGEGEAQPIYLTDSEDNPNGAAIRILLSGVEVERLAGSAYGRIVFLFDGRDEDAVADARRRWSLVKAAGDPLGYWREGDDGGWIKLR